MKTIELIKYYCARVLPQPATEALERFRTRKLRGKDPKVIFSEYFKTNYWGGDESVSGPGSDRTQTKLIRSQVSELIKEFHISSVLDIPCGDFNWMKDVDLSAVQYLGGDIVPELIERNRRFASENRRFAVMDLINDDLPKVDLVIVRDCFIHFSNAHIYASLKRIAESNSTYLLTTTFPAREKNGDILTGQWRAVNLQLPPFGFPKPIRLINEGCTEEDGKYADKSIGLWRISDIPSYS